MKNSIKLFCGIAAIAAVTALFCACGGKPTIYVFAPVDYIDDELCAAFEAETGIIVKYDTFDSNESMYTSLKNDSAARYDVLMPSEYMIERMRKEDMLEKVDWNNIPNVKNIDPIFQNNACDPDGEYFVAYMWGTVGLLYNAETVEEPVDSWSVLWDDNYRKRIFMLDSVRDSIGITLKYLGFSLNTKDTAELEAAKERLIEQRPYTLSYVTDTVKDKMIGGEGDIAVVYSGDAIFAAAENENLRYSVPKEGSNIWYDGIVLLKGLKHKENAEKFINYLCGPEVAAGMSDKVGYTTANRAALDFLPDDMREDPTFWPPDDVIERCEMFVDLGDFKREYEKAWNDILTAK